jgi:hypothetical protein
MAKIALTVAIVLSVVVTEASAATKHHRSPRANPAIYNAIPNNVSLSTSAI